MVERTAVRVERFGTCAEVSLCGPGKGNALGPEVWRELPEAMAELDRDEAVRAVVLRGAGDHFSFGLDLRAMMAELGPLLLGEARAAERTRLHEVILGLQAAVTSLERCRKPVIAAVHGRCIGGGLDIAAACDLRLASAEAQFSLREVRVAMVADLGVLQRLPRIVGQGITREWAFTGDDVPAERALRVGLVNELYPTPQTLFAAARGLAERIAANPPLVVQGIKQVLGASADLPLDRGLQYVAAWNAAFLQSEDLGEAFAAFAEKRPPTFRGR